MRKIFIIITILIGLSVCSYAQTGIPHNIQKKADRDAKELEKAGWEPYLKMPDIKRQLRDAFGYEYSNFEGNSQYFIASSGSRRAMNLHDAHTKAILAARGEIVKAMNSYVSSEIIIKTDLDSNTRQRMLHNIVVTCRQKLGKTEPIVDMYRKLKSGEYEVKVRVVYKKKEVDDDIDAVIKTVSEQIEK